MLLQISDNLSGKDKKEAVSKGAASLFLSKSTLVLHYLYQAFIRVDKSMADCIIMLINN
jgi:hypothetical protein